MKDVKLTQMTRAAGWAAKIGPKDLANVLSVIPKFKNDNLIVGLETSDDAAVYKVSDDKAIILTLDFFTPVVDDPYTFGKIAAANSLSDVYAMGGEPTVAMNIVCFPQCEDMAILREILRGGADKVVEAGAILVGGHTVDDKEPKYGLSVTGEVHPDKVRANSDVKVGDLLVLTKPIGTGIINTAIKGEVATEEDYNEAVLVMEYLNKYPAEALKKVEVNGVTDVTGFGLLGHVLEMAKGSKCSIQINSKDVPMLKNAREYANMGIIPSGMYNNMEYISPDVQSDETVPQEYMDVLYDPQTSGGLLISVSPENVEKLISELKASKSLCYDIIGEAIEKQEKYVIVK